VTETGEKSRMAQLVSRARVQMQQARTQYWSEGGEGRVRQSTLRDLRSSLLQYYDVLREFRGQECIEEKWESKEFDQLPEMIFSEVSVNKETAGHGSGSETDTVPYIQTLSARELVELSYELDDVANKLGFCAETDEKVKETNVTRDLINQAVEKIQSKT